MNCLVCNKEFTPFSKVHKCCSKSCTDKLWSSENKDKRKIIWRRYNHSHKEIIAAKTTANYHKNKPKYVQYRKDHRLENNARTRAKYAMRKAGVTRACIDCQSVNNLHVHHIDFNPLNNSLSNLCFVCITCHGLRHQR